MSAAVEVSDLRVELLSGAGTIVEDVSFSIEAGEILGLVGESGSGKTTVATALLGDARRGALISGGSVRIGAVEVLALGPAKLRRLRGRVVSYISQDPSAALNPAVRIGSQLGELIAVHERATDRSQRGARVRQALAEVNLPASRDFLRRYPHQLSGGQQQRVCIAMAFLLRPQVIVLDEPTTGLDVTTQAHVLATIRELCVAHEVAALYVSHDLAVVSELASRVVVMYAGRTVEVGPTTDVFARPGHPYTRKLVEAIPDVRVRERLAAIAGRAPRPGTRPPCCVFAPRCEAALAICHEQAPPPQRLAAGQVVRCHRALELRERSRPPRESLPAAAASSAPPVLAVRDARALYDGREVLHGVSLELQPRECLALVGESGSGKTTLSRAVVGLVTQARGTVVFEGQELSPTVSGRPRSARRKLQYIFQSPFASLNPRKSIAEIIETPLRHFFDLSRHELVQRAVDALERVELSGAVLRRYPHELSGGERQRVAIARALGCEPSVLICDEITSALDVSVQAAIVELLRELQESQELALLFVTHNLALVRTIADRVAVMEAGRIVETGAAEQILDAPGEAYTRALLDNTPILLSEGRFR